MASLFGESLLGDQEWFDVERFTETYNETIIFALSPPSKSYKVRWYVLTAVLAAVKSDIKQKIFLAWVKVRTEGENCQWRSDFCVVFKSKVLLLQITLYKMTWCRVSLISAGASWEPGDSAFQSSLCDWGWDGERALCAGGQGVELLAGGTKQGRSKGGTRKVVMPLQSEEFSRVKIQLKHILCSA